jgi:PAS domain S-box-containing protein
MVKPFVAQELIARVDSSLALARLRTEELLSMSRLYELSSRLTATSDLSSLLGDALDAVIELQGADFGTIQLYDPDTDTFAIFAQRGFGQDFLDHFRSVDARTQCACGIAARDGQRVIIEDVLVHQEFAPHRAIAASAGFRAVQSTPLIDRNSGSFVGILSTHFREPHRPSERELRLTDLYARQAADIIAFRLSERRMRESESRLKAAVDLLALGCFTLDPRDNTLVWDSRVKAMWGLPPDALIDHRVWRNGIHRDDIARVDAALSACMDPLRNGIYDVEYRVIGITDGVERWIASRGISTFENGAPIAFFGVALDVTARKRTEQANLLLIGELQHRTRNLLAVVQAISRETLIASNSLDNFSVTFDGRLTALSRVQDLLSRANDTPVTIGELVRLELDALAADLSGGRVHVDGPVVALPMRSVQILALALHELATNARKYGALATSEDRLAVTWRTTNEAVVRHLTLEWREQRQVADRGKAQPERRGFGRTLIEDAIPYQLDAETQLEFAPDGVFCSVRILLDA